MRTLHRSAAPAVLLSGLLLGGLLLAREARGQSKGFGCAGVKVDSLPVKAASSTFSASAIEDLEFRVIFSLAPPGRRVLRLRVLMPKGALYQEISVPFALDPRASGGEEAVLEGFPRPVAVRPLQKTTDGRSTRWSVSATLPVAGTMVVENSLYGTWQVEAYLDGEKTPCTPGVSFDLAP